MIDVRSLRENPEPARASQRARGADPALVDQILEADVARREALQNFEALRATQKEVSKSVGRASKEERPAILAQAKERCRCRGRSPGPPAPEPSPRRSSRGRRG